MQTNSNKKPRERSDVEQKSDPFLVPIKIPPKDVRFLTDEEPRDIKKEFESPRLFGKHNEKGRDSRSPFFRNYKTRALHSKKGIRQSRGGQKPESLLLRHYVAKTKARKIAMRKRATLDACTRRKKKREREREKKKEAGEITRRFRIRGGFWSPTASGDQSRSPRSTFMIRECTFCDDDDDDCKGTMPNLIVRCRTFLPANRRHDVARAAAFMMFFSWKFRAFGEFNFEICGELFLRKRARGDWWVEGFL